MAADVHGATSNAHAGGPRASWGRARRRGVIVMIPAGRRACGALRGAVAAVAAAAVGCSGAGTLAPPEPTPWPGEPAPVVSVVPPLPDTLDAEARRWVDETLASLDLRGAAAQLVMKWIPGDYVTPTSPELDEPRRWVEEGIGGLYLSVGTPLAYAAKVDELQALARVPLLFGSDFEDGGPGMRINHTYALPGLQPQGGGTSFPPTMAFGAIADERFAREYGRITAVEARAVGVRLNFAPVLDVNSNPANPVIGTRSFGGDAELVARLGAAFIRGSHEGGVLATAKHFPEPGDTETDSHLGLPVVVADRNGLDTLELVPFRRAIAGGVDAVMTAHVSLPRLLGFDAPPATLSPEILTGLLRGDLGFRGLLLTDALTMAAISDGWSDGEAAVAALEAGADVLLDPADVDAALDAVIAAVARGRLTEARVRESARRVLEAKARVGLHREPFVDLDGVDERVGTGAHVAFADSAAERSMTLVRDRAEALPFGPRVRRVLSVTFAPDRDPVAGRAFDAGLRLGLEVRGEGSAVRGVRLEPASPPSAYGFLSRELEAADAVVVGVYGSASAGTGLDALPSALRSLVRRAAGERPTVLVSFGNPYLLTAFPQAPAYLVAWGPREVSQRAAARALLGEVAVSGRLPVRVGAYPVGFGLERSPRPPSPFPVVARPEAVAGLPRAAPPGDSTAAGVGRGAPPPGAGVSGAGVRNAERPAAGAGGEGRPGAAPISPPEPVPVSYRLGDEVGPAAVGMDAAGLARVDSLLGAAVSGGPERWVAPGAALAIGRHGRLVRLRGYGTLDGPGSAAVTPASLYDIASLTKVIGTTTAVMMLDEAGQVDLDAPAVRYLPWWSAGDPRKATVTVRQLLLHRAGLPPFRRWFFELDGEEAYRKAVADEPLEWRPGTRTAYSDLGAMTLAFLVEAVSGERLDSFLRERLFGPLGMDDTGYLPEPALLPRIAPTEVDTLWRGVKVEGAVHDENADAMGGIAGHAGIFSTVADLAVFADLMLQGGVAPPCRPGDGTPCPTPRADSVRLLRPETVQRYTRRYDRSSSRALGWDTPSGESSAGDLFSSTSFGHTGFTGTSIWIDPERDLFVILLTNRVDPTRDNGRIVPLRRELHDDVARAVTDHAARVRTPRPPPERP